MWSVSTLVILGAGELGGALARQAVASAVARQVVLVDDAADAARGKALDIQQAAAIDGVAVAVSATNELGAVVGADVVVLADGFGPPAREHQSDAAVALLARVRQLNERALIVCAGASQLDAVERVTHDLGRAAGRIVGSAPEALRAGVVALTALASQAAPAEVSLLLVGRPPRHVIVPWTDAAIGGRRLTEVLSPPEIAAIEARLPHLWPPQPLTLAAAAWRVAALALTSGPGTPVVFTVPVASEGPKAAGVALPATMTGGEVRPLWPALAPRDRTRLETARAR